MFFFFFVAIVLMNHWCLIAFLFFFSWHVYQQNIPFTNLQSFHSLIYYHSAMKSLYRFFHFTKLTSWLISSIFNKWIMLENSQEIAIKRNELLPFLKGIDVMNYWCLIAFLFSLFWYVYQQDILFTIFLFFDILSFFYETLLSIFSFRKFYLLINIVCLE